MIFKLWVGLEVSRNWTGRGMPAVRLPVRSLIFLFFLGAPHHVLRPQEVDPNLASLVSGSPAHTYSRVVRFLISSLGPRLQLLGEARGAGGRPPRAWLRETPPQET